MEHSPADFGYALLGSSEVRIASIKNKVCLKVSVTRLRRGSRCSEVRVERIGGVVFFCCWVLQPIWRKKWCEAVERGGEGV